MASQDSMTASQEPETTSQEPKMISQEPETTSQEPEMIPQESKVASQEPTVTSPEPKMISQGSKSASQEPNTSSQEPNTSSQEPVTTTSSNPSSKYSNRVVLKTILEPSDKWREFLDERVVVGGWVKTSKELNQPAVPEPQQQTTEAPNVSPGHKDVRCVEIFQSRIPIFRSIAKIFGGGGSSHPVREKPEPAIPEPPQSSVAYLLVSDGSSVASLQVVVDSSVAPLSELLPTGTCILVEGVLQEPSTQAKHSIELKVEQILHIGKVEQDRYPLSKRRLPLEALRDCSHFRPRTTTVASVTRISSSLSFATQTFFHDKGFLYVQVPIITTTDGEGFSEKFQVTTVLGKDGKQNDTGGVSLEVVKAAVIQKSNLVEELKRSESNREALASAIQDLHKTNQLASQLEAKEKLKSGPSMKVDKPSFYGEFFSQQTYLTVSGLLHLESYACALGNVFSFGPRFRADRKESAKRISEMWMVEVQMAFSQLEDAMNCADEYFKFLCKWILNNCSEDMEFVSKRIDKSSSYRLESMISSSIEKISYMEALKKVAVKFKINEEWGIALTPEHLSYLAEDVYRKPVIIYNYPKELKPFYVRLNDDGKTAAAFDMVVPKVGTIITGSQSEERIDMLNKTIEELHLPREQYEWYLDLRRHGTVEHSGFSLGFDLMVMFTTGLPDVRDVIPFPRSRGKANN
ncbi:asparagine--tRNA ligase, cytoplasmic 2 [Populus alba]|uniref:asparagine--tRNA ligase n=1 Tax=Populus alba TaxID=43335 RepID=A0A4U5QMT4_POPAL|nr:asparagine--tRNA ligase, cytoplasmic 2 [Populus alba]TKS12103.1 asparagine--tRNA ligase, cytoplasmic 2-like isoform X2 [Populus alba]